MKTFLAVMVLALAIAVPAAASHQFSDVPTNHPHHDNISWLAANGVTAGCNAAGDRFCPDEPVTRAQLATFMRRFANNVTSGDGSDGLPAGAIVMMPAGQSCPSGYSTVTALDERFPRGSTSSGYGGTTSHSHAHPHTHSVSITTEAGWESWIGGFNAVEYDDYGGSGSAHDHRVTGDTGQPSSWETDTDPADHLPPYYNVRFCSKG